MTSLRAIAVALPEREVTNADLDRENPSWRMSLVEEVSGVRSRRIAAEDETAFDLSVQACEELLSQPGVAREEIDAILYCTQDPDHFAPGNSQLLHAHLGLDDAVLAFDYYLACSGFVYGLAVADALTRAGTASGTLLVTAETQSKRMHPRDRSVRTLLGDGAAVTYLAGERLGDGRIVAYDLNTHGRGYEHAYVPAGGARRPSTEETRREVTDRSGNVRTAEDMHMNGTEVWAFVNTTMPSNIERFLIENGLTLDDIDLFVFHQASKLILDSLAKALGVAPEKVFTCMEETGNLSSASIPFALHAAQAEGAIRPGDRVLLSAFGAGISYGSAILEYRG